MRVRAVLAWLLLGAGVAGTAYPALAHATGALTQVRLAGEVRTLVGAPPAPPDSVPTPAMAQSVERRAAPRPPARKPADGEALGFLRIPSVGIDEVFLEGVSHDVLRIGPGHLPWTALPGPTGVTVVAAHRDLHFRDLKDVRPGARVVVATDAGTVAYRVISRRIADPDDAWVTRRLRDPVLRLVTCWPPTWIGPAPQRLVVSAIPVGPTDGSPVPSRASDRSSEAEGRLHAVAVAASPGAPLPAGALPPLGTIGAATAALAAFGAYRTGRRLAWWFLPWTGGLGLVSLTLVAAWAGPGLVGSA